MDFRTSFLNLTLPRLFFNLYSLFVVSSFILLASIYCSYFRGKCVRVGTSIIDFFQI